MTVTMIDESSYDAPTRSDRQNRSASVKTTDLRNDLDAFEAAARRLAALQPPGAVIPLTAGDRRFGFLVRRLRKTAGLTLEGLATRCHVTRKGMCNRELHASAMSAGALIETLDALGYDVLAVRRPA